MDTAHAPQAAQDILQSAPAGIHGHAPAGMPLREIAVFRQFQAEKAADVNGNGKVDIMDILAMQKDILGIQKLN